MKAIIRWGALFALTIFLAAPALTVRAQTWSGTNGPWGGSIRCMTYSGTNLFAGTWEHGIFMSSNNGASWSPVAHNVDTTVVSIAASGNIILAGATNGCVLLSTDNGQHWGSLSVNSAADVGAVAIDGTTLLAATQAEGVFVSVDNGMNWGLRNSGLRSQNVSALAASGGVVYAAIGNASAGYSSLRKSTNDGTKWDTIPNGGTNSSIHCIGVASPLLIVGTEGGVYFSVDGGANWIQRNNGLADTTVFSLAVSSTTIYAGTVDYSNPSGVFAYSIAQGLGGNWSSASVGLSANTGSLVYALAASGTNVTAGTDDGVFASANGGAHWASSNTGLSAMTITSLASNGSLLVAGTDDFEVHWSTDAGGHWTHSANGLARAAVRNIAFSGTSVFLATDDGFYRSNDAGATWSRKVAGMVSDSVGPAIIASGTTLYAGTNTQAVYQSANNGDSWSQVRLGLTKDGISAMTANSTNVFAGCSLGGIFTSLLGSSLTWSQLSVGLTTVGSIPVGAMTTGGSNVYASTLGGGVFVSSDNTTWTQVAPSTTEIQRSVALATSSDTLYIASQSQGVFCARKGAVGWKAVPFGLSTDTLLASLAVQGSLLFAGTADHGVQQSPMPSSAPPGAVNTPGLSGLSFDGTYPNPVAGQASIAFTLDAPRAVTLSITDASGRETKLISNELVTAGPHTFEWDATRFPAGIYLCRLAAGGQSMVQNIVVAR